MMRAHGQSFPFGSNTSVQKKRKNPIFRWVFWNLLYMPENDPSLENDPQKNGKKGKKAVNDNIEM